LQKRVEKISKIIEFEETRGGKSIGRLAAHVSRFGMDHLVFKHGTYPAYKQLDLDIWAMVFLALFVSWYVVKKITRVVFYCCCCCF